MALSYDEFGEREFLPVGHTTFDSCLNTGVKTYDRSRPIKSSDHRRPMKGMKNQL